MPQRQTNRYAERLSLRRFTELASRIAGELTLKKALVELLLQKSGCPRPCVMNRGRISSHLLKQYERMRGFRVNMRFIRFPKSLHICDRRFDRGCHARI